MFLFYFIFSFLSICISLNTGSHTIPLLGNVAIVVDSVKLHCRLVLQYSSVFAWLLAQQLANSIFFSDLQMEQLG